MATKEVLTRSSSDLAQMIDHTLLRPEATTDMITALCEEAKEWGFYSVCVNPCHVTLAKELLLVSNVKVCTVVGFPLGANETQVKAFEAQCAVDQGADEIDMVINLGALKADNTNLVQTDIRAVVEASQSAKVKVILETCLLSPEEIRIACQLSKEAGAHFVKTSTGMNSRGALIEEVSLMRKIVGNDMGVKASGGIRDLSSFLQMLDAGANRIGTSSGINILQSLEKSQ